MLSTSVIVRAVGSDIARGQEVLRPGQRLGPSELGLLATVGVTSVQCYAVPTVGVMSTGNEVRKYMYCFYVSNKAHNLSKAKDNVSRYFFVSFRFEL